MLRSPLDYPEEKSTADQPIRRRHPRIPLNATVTVTDRDGQAFTLFTRDISKGGAFLVCNLCGPKEVARLKRLEVGEEVWIQAQEWGEQEEAPIVCARVVRQEVGGLAVQFQEEEDEHHAF